MDETRERLSPANQNITMRTDPANSSDPTVRLRQNTYHVERELLSVETLEVLTKRSEKVEVPIQDRLKKHLECSQSKAKSLLFRFIPILVWIPKYPYKDWLLNDIISGLSVGIMQLPQSMAYALLAGVPPAFGLYTAFYPVLIYFTFGTSRHVSIGTFAVLSVMIGTVTERLAPDGDFVISSDNSTNATLVIDIAARDLMRVKVATLLTFFSGVYQIVLGLIKFGFVVTYLSDPLVRGYTTAAAIHVLISQLKYVFGINIPRYNGPLSLIYVVIATVVSANCNLTGKYGVDVVGSIPKGLQAPVLPEFEMSSSIIGDAFAVAIVGYGITISLGKIFGLKHGYQVDSNQELIALGLSNFVGGFFQCFGVSCSMSRSLVQESTGGQTQLASVVSCILILVVILEIGSLFSALPKAVLASIIIINLQGMFKQFRDICHFWKTNKVDLMIWVVTLLSTVLLGMDIGLAASVGFALLTVIFQTQLPTYSILGQVPMTDIYRDITKFDTAKEISGIKIFQSTATIYFANAELYEEALKKKMGIDVAVLITKKKKRILKLEKKQKKMAKKEKKAEKKQKGQSLNKEKQVEHTTISDTLENRSISVNMDMEQPGSGPEKHTLESLGLQKPNVHSLILDFSPVNFVDSVCIKIIKNIFRDFAEIEIDVYLSGCHWSIIQQFEKGEFFGKTITKSHLFHSLHDAVLHCLAKHQLPSEQPALMNGHPSLSHSQNQGQEASNATTKF
ncbi:solute carrier family 26 member 6 isoform X4 [Callorhinchus milii]|uniref:solute carrier family 26 member 6 isoform X4 n=1 Tax=Callorhinchus milii TaxID=7868 RepID=UPI0004573298|nr:solute carrier family 26 member 6 isoform X4 [Callorhinchus milii]|eukprot:gi/632946184/ref/XP_007888433.1/ PREDICTED: solute carrier family 26 member 6 isoform X4 [Callorhinchus milii]